MPSLDTNLHVSMHRVWRWRRAAGSVLRKVGIDLPLLRVEEFYGYDWGDPEVEPRLVGFRDRFLTPYVNPAHRAVEIGPGGGRWTQYLLGFQRVYAVDFYQPLLNELESNIDAPNVELIKNNGVDFPGIPEGDIDYVFSFGTFVHLELDTIDAYLENIARILKPNGNVVIQYSDMGKQAARDNAGFADNDPERMRELVERHGYRILGEDLTSFGHSAIVHCTR